MLFLKMANKIPQVLPALLVLNFYNNWHSAYITDGSWLSVVGQV